MKQGHLVLMFLTVYVVCCMTLYVEQRNYDRVLSEKQRVEAALLEASYTTARSFEKVWNVSEEIRKSTVATVFFESFSVSMGLFASGENQQILEMYVPMLILAEEDGYIAAMDTESCGIASSMLGAGRETKESAIDFSAGIVLHRKVGDPVAKGEPLATMYASQEELFAGASRRYLQALTFSKEKPEKRPLIFARITKDGIERF